MPATLSVQRRAREDYRLEDLLRIYFDTKCRDVRDKVYGLIGLANDYVDNEESDLLIDYATTPVDLFFDVMDFCRPSKTAQFGVHLADMLGLPTVLPRMHLDVSVQTVAALHLIGVVTHVENDVETRWVSDAPIEEFGTCIGSSRARRGDYILQFEGTMIQEIFRGRHSSMIKVGPAVVRQRRVDTVADPNLSRNFVTSAFPLARIPGGLRMIWKPLDPEVIQVEVTRQALWNLLGCFKGKKLSDTVLSDRT